MQYDVIVWQIEGFNLALARTEAGLQWLRDTDPVGQGDAFFLDYLESIPAHLRIGVLDPTGKLLNFRSGVLH
jgi:hypothetical protein